MIFALFAICLVSCDDDNDESESTATTVYKVGDKGPAGGIICYDCDADNEDGNADGLKSSECGWRYLEAAPADLRVVGSTPTVDSYANGYSDADDGYKFGIYYIGTSSNLYVNGSTDPNSTGYTGTEIGTGKNNTEMLTDVIVTANNAAKLCDILEYTKDGVKYDDWFLPSIYELNLMYTNLHEKELGDFEGDSSNFPYYWSSSEGENASAACGQNFSNGESINNYGRSNSLRVRPVRAFI